MNAVITKRDQKKAILRRTGTINAASAIDGFDKDHRVSGLTNGAFSLLSLIEAVLNITGPADVVISTWSAGMYDSKALNSMMSSGNVKKVRMILDRSFKTRQAQYSVYIDDVFNTENIRTTNTHAKFVLIKNTEWNIVIRSSMNLNENKRCENYDIDDDTELYSFFESFVDDLFEKQPAGIIENRATVDPVFDTLFDQDFVGRNFFNVKTFD